MQNRILVVEDDHVQRSVLEAALAADGYETETCANGLDAVWRIREGRFDLVLLDYQLPEIDGLATARLIGDLMGRAARPCLIALTATPDSVIGRELLAERAFDEVVSKTVDLSKLLAIIDRHLRAAPDCTVRQAAEFDVLLQEWAGYDTPLGRPKAEPGRTSTVLVVEDNEAQRSVLKAALETQGYAVDTAPDGLSGMRKLRAEGYDLALIDYELPEIDGLTTARLIGEFLNQAVRPRLVALTATPERLAARVVPHRIFDEVVSKLDGLPAVLATVASQLRSA